MQQTSPVLPQFHHKSHPPILTPPFSPWRCVAFALLIACLPGVTAYGVAQTSTNNISSRKESMIKIRLNVAGEYATATLYNNATARDFASLLPLSLTMSDYDTIERVATLPRKLSTQGAPEGMAPVTGELTHYAPWSNLAIFIEPRSFSRHLLPLGKVDTGLSVLSQSGPYRVQIELIEPP